MTNIMAVGATDMSDSNAPGSPADFSSRGPTNVTGTRKPDVSAPGANVISAYNNGNIGGMSGTSMAAPHVAGEAALLWSAVPELRGDVQLTYWVIEQSTLPLTVDQGYFCGSDDAASVPNNQYGWGRIDALQAVSLALSSNWEIPWLSVEPVSGTVAPSASAEIALTFDTTGLTQGECYTGTLKVEYNDPYVMEQMLPVELCVLVPAPELSISKSVEPLEQFAGDPVTYTIVFGNHGTASAMGVVVSDVLPSEVEFVSADPAGTYDPAAHELSWAGLTLDAGDVITATVRVTIDASALPDTWITNTVYLFYGLEPLMAEVSHYIQPPVEPPMFMIYLPIMARNW
jgi:uncharacterized repeat protein (TIGR01451 family)